jgi:RNA polymerase subunit RPABC4/transcription elongation factor Spt4
MKFNICHNCGERVTTVKEKCPKCGIVPEKNTSPVVIGFIAVLVLIVIAVIGLIFF